MILLMGSAHDRTMVHTLAAARVAGVAHQFFDMVRFLQAGRYRWDFARRTGSLAYDDVEVVLPAPSVTGIYVRIVDISDGVDVAERGAVRTRLRALTEILRNTPTPVVNRPRVDMSNWAKAFHQHLLSQCGFRTPRSMLTNDPEEARAFLRARPATIFKGASGEKTIASEFRSDMDARLSRLPASPVLFQERIFGADVRTHLVGTTFVSERIESDAVNYQYDRAPVVYKPATIPRAVEQMCRDYQDMSGLAFIGFDFIVTDAGEHFVLEANPMPGYDVFDRRGGGAISRALFRVLQDAPS